VRWAIHCRDSSNVKAVSGTPQSELVENVSQSFGRPESMPRLNQRTRCSDEPWVNDSGTTRPCVCFCRRSSPIAVAALSPSAMSPNHELSNRHLTLVLVVYVPGAPKSLHAPIAALDSCQILYCSFWTGVDPAHTVRRHDFDDIHRQRMFHGNHSNIVMFNIVREPKALVSMFLEAIPPVVTVAAVVPIAVVIPITPVVTVAPGVAVAAIATVVRNDDATTHRCDQDCNR
jgi:hypothetical protein